MGLLQGSLTRIVPIDIQAADRAQERLDSLTKPQGSLGRLEELAKQVAGITGHPAPTLKNKAVFTLAADHGITKEGVSAFPSEVTAQMVLNFLHNGAGINVLARHAGARVVVVDMGVAIPLGIDSSHFPQFRDRKIMPGTRDWACGPAMTREEALRAIETGIALVNDELAAGLDIVGIGDMGIGTTAASAAITAVITGKEIAEVTGKGAGITNDALQHKIEVIRKALKLNVPDPRDGIDVLAKVGGLEIGGLAGVIIGAAAHRIPVVIDGFISGAAALIAHTIDNRTKDFMIASHRSVEQGHKTALRHLGLKPILDLDLRLGEGTGAALGISIVDASLKVLNEMATFQEASVSGKVRP